MAQKETIRLTLRTLVILPTYNEKDSLEETVSQLLTAQPRVSVLIVDDASPDGTGAIANKLSEVDARISVLHRSQKAGLGPAYLAGFELGRGEGYDLLVEMDADGSHRAQDLGALLKAAQSADLVIGSRWIAGGSVENWPKRRQLISRVGNTYARLLLGSKIKDMTAGFRVYRSKLLSQVVREDLAAHGYAFQVELAWRCERSGASVVEVPITFIEREHGTSKMSSAIVREALWLITTWGFRRLFTRG
jgi:dolichol-phosphate mannosyltransferase